MKPNAGVGGRQELLEQRALWPVLIVAIAVWAGFLTGLVEVSVLWFKQAIFGQVVFASRHMLWMTPVVYMTIFALMAVAVAGGAVAFPRRITTPVVVFLFTTLAVGCLLLPIGSIHRAAELLLAVGVGVQAARTAAQPTRLRRIAAVLTLAMVLAVALMGVAGWAMRGSPRRSAVAVDSPALGGRLPSVLIIIWDTVRAANLSLYGYGLPTTPSLDRLAEQSVVFDRAIVTSPWTLPSHATMFTGRFPHELSASWFTKLDATYPTLAEVFRAAGYRTGGFVANHHYTAYDSGLDRGFEVYRDYRLSLAQVIESSALTQAPTMKRLIRSRSLGEAWDAIRSLRWWVPVKRSSDPKHAEEVNREFLAWQGERPHRPFFAFLNYFDAHRPYWAPQAFRERFTAAPPPMDRYDAAIAYLDDQVGQLLRALESVGVLDNTIVVVTSDHGELFGEHGLYGHAHNLYFPVLHVPLLIRFPAGAQAGRRVAHEVSLRDLPTTMLDLAGLESGEASFPGRTLARYWRSDAPGGAFSPLLAEVEQGRNNPPEHPITRGPMQSLVADGFHYIRNGDGQEELYAYERDPEEEDDLARSGASPAGEALDRFRSALDRLVGPTRVARPAGAALRAPAGRRAAVQRNEPSPMLQRYNTPSRPSR